MGVELKGRKHQMRGMIVIYQDVMRFSNYKCHESPASQSSTALSPIPFHRINLQPSPDECILSDDHPYRSLLHPPIAIKTVRSLSAVDFSLTATMCELHERIASKRYNQSDGHMEEEVDSCDDDCNDEAGNGCCESHDC